MQSILIECSIPNPLQCSSFFLKGTFLKAKILTSIKWTTFFVLALFGIYYAHMRLFRVDVVFYSSLFDALLAAILVGGLLCLPRANRSLGLFEKGQLIAIWLLLGYGFAISIPTVIDRSLSFYIIEKIQQRGGGIKRDSLMGIFTGEFVVESRLDDVRLTEQLESGTVELKDGCIILTPKGHMIASFGQFFRKNLLPKERLLMGEYSDDLTDPFRKSPKSVNYTCSR